MRDNINESVASTMPYLVLLKEGVPLTKDILEQIKAVFDHMRKEIDRHNYAFKKDKHFCDYTTSDLTEMHDVWNRTIFVQPPVAEKHIGIINKLIQENTIG